jgi:ABC-type lipoprotein export system ATPase subunit
MSRLERINGANGNLSKNMKSIKDPYITCEDLFKIYKVADLEVVALRGLDLKVSQGEVVAIVGASGSGKSTLLNILAGYDAPSAGKVTVGIRDLVRMTSKEAEEYRRHEVGFIWQQTSKNLFPYLTAMENIALPMILTTKDEKYRKQKSLELLDLVNLSHRRDHTPDKLSGGEQQRVAIAVSLANDPSLLLADEPTAELDGKTASEILNLFGELNQKINTTIVIVTHDPDISYKVGRVVFIRDGKTSMEIRRATKYQSVSGTTDLQQELKEFTLVDTTGRLQIPAEMLAEIGISERAIVNTQDGKITISREHTD